MEIISYFFNLLNIEILDSLKFIKLRKMDYSMQLFKQHILFHHCFPHQEHFRQKLLFERHIELTKLYSKRLFDRTIFAIGLKIGNVIGTNRLKHHHDYCFESYR